MFCTKCGKKLNDDDRFCAYCGSEVRTRREERYEDVIFNPPFKVEAQKKTQEILDASLEKEQPSSNVKESVEFNWNLDGFPPAQPRKTEAVDFSWDGVISQKSKETGDFSEKKAPLEEVTEVENSLDKVDDMEPEDEEAVKEESLSIEDLEKEIFGEEEPAESPSETVEPKTIWFEALKNVLGEEKKDDSAGLEELDVLDEPEGEDTPSADERFYTFNQKKEAFEELLRKEKEKLSEMQLDEEYCQVEVPAEIKAEAEQEEPAEIKAEAVQEEPAEIKSEAKQEPLQVVDIIQPVTPLTVDNVNETTEIREGEEVAKEQQPPSKDKLRYSDIFPRVDTAGDGNNSTVSGQDNSVYQESVEEPVKKHILLKVLITLLVLLIIAEGIVIAVKFIAPESAFSEKVNYWVAQVVDLFTNGGNDEVKDTPEVDSQYTNEDDYINQLIIDCSSDAKTIGQVNSDSTLLFDMNNDYDIDEIYQTRQFVDEQWKEGKDGSAVFFSKGIIDAVIKYYDEWKESNADAFLVGINKLDIGEIRTGEKGFYVLCRITYAGADGKEVVKYQVPYAEKIEDLIIVNSVGEVNN